MKKSLSLLLAFALVISMFATSAFAADADLTQQQKFDALKTAGIFNGYPPNGDPGFERDMTRAEFAKVAVLLFGKTQDAASNKFTDVPATHWAAGYIGAATAAGYVNGVGLNKFNPNGKITIEQMAKILATAAGLEEASATVSGTMSDWAKGWVAAAIQANLFPAQDNYKANAKRSLLIAAAYSVWAANSVKVTGSKVVDATHVEVTFSDNEKETVTLTTALEAGKATTIQVTHKGVSYPVVVTLEQAAISASATGAKKITVTFNKAVDDTKATFTVKKGTISLNVANKVWAADKKSVVLELSSMLTAGDYTVAVGGVEATDLTAKVTATDEKVSKIEITSKNLPLVDSDADGNKDDVVANYKVYNQYNEDITKLTTVTTNVGVVDASKGTVTIAGNYKVNDVVAITVIHAQSATSALATLTVAPEAKVAELTITGLYNKDNKTLSEATALGTDQFYLTIDAKDQYGNTITDAGKLASDLVAPVESNNTVITTSTYTTVDGKTALQLVAPAGGLKAGSNQITLISNTTGKSAQFTVTVAESKRADKINLINPGMIVADEDTYIPVEVFDKQGTPITDLSVLNDASTNGKGVKVTLNGVAITNPFVIKDKVVQIKLTKAQIGATAGLQTLIAMPATYSSTSNIANLSMDVKAKAIARVIRGVDSDFAKTTLTSQTGKTLKISNLAVEDQYGRVMSDSALKAWLNADADRKIEITESNSPNNAVTFTDATISVAGDVENGATYDTASTNGSEKITLTLRGDDGALINTSAADVTLRVTNGSEYSSYTVDAIGTVYDERGAAKTNDAAYNKTVKVFGVLSDGTKVQLTEGTDYKVNALSNASIDSDVNNNGIIEDFAALTYESGKTETVVPITVTINKTAEQITQDVTFSKAAPKITAVKVVGPAATVDGDAVTSITAGAATFNINDLVDGTVGKVVVTDQYGAKVFATLADGQVAFTDGTTVTAVNFRLVPVTGTVSITGNGTYAAQVTGLDAYESVDAVITYPNAVAATVRVNG